MPHAEPGQVARTLTSLLDLLPIGVAIAYDRQCSWISTNRAASELLGLARDDNASKSAPVPPAGFKVFRNGLELTPEQLPMQLAASQGIELRDFEVQLLRSDGTLLELLEYATPLLNHNNDIIGAVGVFVDVTPYRVATRERLRSELEAQSKLQLLRDSIEDRVRERTSDERLRADQLLSLAVSLADTDATDRKTIAQVLHDQLQQILSAAKLKSAMVRRMNLPSHLVEHIRDLERLIARAISECRSLALRLAPPLLYERGLNPAIEAFARNLERSSPVHIVVACDALAEPLEERIRILLFEAACELVNNALSHASATRITVSSRLTPAGHIELTVQDDGCGFDPDELPRQLGTGGNRRMGLIGIRERLREVGGHVLVSSTLGHGTRVLLSIVTELRTPLDAPESVVAPLAPDRPALAMSDNPPGSSTSLTPATPAPSIPPLPQRKFTLVVADDHAIFREGLVSLLRQESFLDVIGEAGDGEVAVELVRQLQPDLLIVDISMPKLNGLQVTGILSREFPALKIVGLSMHDAASMAVAMRDAGAAAYLTKDGASEALIGILRSLVPHLSH